MKLTKSNDSKWEDALQTAKFGQRRKALQGGQRLQSSVWELAPGKRSFPFHFHHVTEEALFVISGRGKVRTPEGEIAIGPGDHAFFPAGGPAHQLINDGTEPLVYLGISAVSGVDVVEYPDTKKIAASVGGYPNGKRVIFYEKDQAGYLDGEE